MTKILATNGMTLIEVMIAGAIGSMIMLGMATSMRYGLMGLKTFTIQQAASSFRNQVQATLDNPIECTKIFSTSTGTVSTASTPIDPTQPAMTTTAVNLTMPFGKYNTTTKNRIDDRINIFSISFQKISDVISKDGSSGYTMNGNRYYPVIGQLNIVLDNQAVTQHIAYGSSRIIYSFPLSLTFVRSGSTWNIDQCAAQTIESKVNVGWFNDAECIKPDPIEAGNTAGCPAHYYIVKQVQSTKPKTIYTPSCSCDHDKGGSCWEAAGTAWSCSNQCSDSGAVINLHSSCAGSLCYSSPSCTPSVTTVPQLEITCCRVRK